MQINSVFAIFDPTSDNHRILDMLERRASENNITITAFCCVHNNYKTSDQEMSVQIEKQRYELWLDSLLAPIKAKGANVKIKIAWNPDWRDGLASAVKNVECDFIVKNSYSNTDSRRAKSVDRLVLRNAKVPVVFLRKKDNLRNGNVLAAIKSENLGPLHEKANQSIIDFCGALATLNPSLQIHAATVYTGSDHFIYPEDFAKRVGLDRSRVMTLDTTPVEGLKSAVEKLNAEMIMIGSVERKGVVGRLLGNTAEQLLNEIDTDVIAFIQREE